MDDKAVIVDKQQQERKRSAGGVATKISTMKVCQSTLPFHCYDRPEIPHVDTYINKDHLKSSNLGHYATPFRKDLETRDISPSGEFVRNGTSQSDHIDDNMYDDDTRGVIKFIRLCGNKSQNYITLRDLESAFRKCKRNPHVDVVEGNEKVQNLLKDIEKYLDIRHITPHRWFKSVIRCEAGHYEQRVSWYDFKYGVKQLCRQVGAEPWLDEELLCVLHYFDPTNEGYITSTNFSDYFVSSHTCDPQKIAMQLASPQMLYILDLIRLRQMRIRDLFRSLDPDHHDRVSVRLLAEGFHKMFADDDVESGFSLSSGLDSRSRSSKQDSSEFRLPFIGGTDCTNKKLLRRLIDTRGKLEDSKFASDPQVMSPHISSKQRSRRMPYNSPKKFPFNIEDSNLEKPALKKSSPDDSSSLPDASLGMADDDDDFSVYSRASSSEYAAPAMSNHFERKISVHDDDKSSMVSSSSHGTFQSSSTMPSRKVNPARSVRQVAAIRSQILAETKGYDSWVDQFDKKVEIYLKRLDRI